MATMDEILLKLAKLGPRDRDLVNSLVDHLSRVDIPEEEKEPDDPELYWGVITGDDAWRQKAAEPLWAELAELQKKPSENWRDMAELKKRLRALGQI